MAQVVCSLDVGGTEKWLLEVVKFARMRFGGAIHFDFITLLKDGGTLEPELRALGCNIYHIPFAWRRAAAFSWRLAQFLRAGRYSAVHCQVEYLSGIVLPCAALARVPRRVCHVHNTRFPLTSSRSGAHHILARFLKELTLMSAHSILGCSQAALAAFLGPGGAGSKGKVFYCAIPLGDYVPIAQASKQQARRQLGWREDAKILLHVGRHGSAKNVAFLLEMFRRLAARDKTWHLMLAGQGELTENLKAEVRAAGLEQRVTFLGMRSDTAWLMRAADLMVYPSFYEGLPVALLEAQAVGLRVLASNAVTQEVEVVQGMVERMSLEAGADAWANETARLLMEPPANAEACCAALQQSEFDLAGSVPRLLSLYGLPTPAEVV